MQVKKSWKAKNKWLQGFKMSLVITMLMICFFAVGTYQTKVELKDKETQLLENGIRQGVMQCYAIEGRYPPTVEYLKQHYGVQIDHRKYIVHYDIFASNIYPDITIVEKGWRDRDE